MPRDVSHECGRGCGLVRLQKRGRGDPVELTGAVDPGVLDPPLAGKGGGNGQLIRSEECSSATSPEEVSFFQPRSGVVVGTMTEASS